MSAQPVEIGGGREITIYDVCSVAYDNAPVTLSKEGAAAIERSRAVVEKLLEEEQVVYGLTTGFGPFKDVFIGKKDTINLQKNLLRSHSVGVGDILSKEATRASFFVRINSLAQGYSGVRVKLIDKAIEILNADIVPVVPSQGSVGASGDLAPLSHMGLVLLGEGEVFYKGERVPTEKAFKKAGIEPLDLAAKEGLAWNNGTSVMLGIMSLSIVKAERLAQLADIACALTLEAVHGVSTAFRSEIHKLRPHAGQIKSAENIRELIKNSKLVDSDPERVQDAYSIRCAPQVHGASRDTLTHVKNVVTIELNSVTDNPLIIPDTGEAISGGNFHGEPLAQAADSLAIAMTEIASISERRTARLVDSNTNGGLPAFLIPSEKAGLHSGLMMPQYTAAALVSENKVLSHPASVDSIPTSANQEDHVSMGNIAARKCYQVITNVEQVLAIEYLTAVQAIDFSNPDQLGDGTSLAYKHVREKVAFIDSDRELHKDIAILAQLFTSTTLLNDVFKS